MCAPTCANIAMVFQSAALYPNMTVAENIGFPLKLAGVGAAAVAARVAQVAGQLELTNVLDRKPGRLSGGQQQRAAMGRAIIRDPRLFLMDEPMSNFDAKLRTHTRHEIAEMQRRLGVTTIYVTHDQVEAMALGDRVGVMRGGRIVQLGSPMELYQRPDNIFVAQFIGSPPMSLVSATVVHVDGLAALRIGSQQICIDEAALRHMPLLSEMVNRSVVLGVRPEALLVDPSGSLVASAVSVERLGDHQLVTASIDAPPVPAAEAAVEAGIPSGSTIIARMDGIAQVSLWQPLRLRIDPAQIHLFDPSTGDAIDVGGQR